MPQTVSRFPDPRGQAFDLIPPGPDCLSRKEIVVLVPQTRRLLETDSSSKAPSSPDNNYTTSADPSIILYLPENTINSLEFKVSSKPFWRFRGFIRHQISGNPPTAEGLYQIRFSALPNFSGLRVYQQRLWNVGITCLSRSREEKGDLGASLQRIAPSSDLVSQLERATQPQEKSAVYLANGIWHDAISILYEARLANPDDHELRQAWISLLNELDLSQPSDLRQRIENAPLRGALVLSDKDGQ
jgi:hypothetical protein